MTPYYDEDGITIYHGDCREVMADLGTGGFDMVFTSPPYNLGISSGGGFPSGEAKGAWSGGALARGYEEHDDAMDPAEYREWQRQVLKDCWAQLSEAGAIFYNHKPRVQHGELWTPLTLNPGLPLRQIIIWDRGGGHNYAPTHFVPSHEWVMVLARPAWRLRDKSASSLGDVWRIPPESRSEHPAPFPLRLPTKAIEGAGPRSVLDPFMGSGTTLRAAKDAGIPAVGIEKSEKYCEIAVQRLAQGVLEFT